MNPDTMDDGSQAAGETSSVNENNSVRQIVYTQLYVMKIIYMSQYTAK